MPNSARSMPSGNGGSSGLPLTMCASGTGMRAVRPGSASSGEGISIFFWNSQTMACVSS